jgi:hypothetical protein
MDGRRDKRDADDRAGDVRTFTSGRLGHHRAVVGSARGGGSRLDTDRRPTLPTLIATND